MVAPLHPHSMDEEIMRKDLDLQFIRKLALNPETESCEQPFEALHSQARRHIPFKSHGSIPCTNRDTDTMRRWPLFHSATAEALHMTNAKQTS